MPARGRPGRAFRTSDRPDRWSRGGAITDFDGDTCPARVGHGIAPSPDAPGPTHSFSLADRSWPGTMAAHLTAQTVSSGRWTSQSCWVVRWVAGADGCQKTVAKPLIQKGIVSTSEQYDIAMNPQRRSWEWTDTWHASRLVTSAGKKYGECSTSSSRRRLRATLMVS
jgi:hypothetical protein